jgi:hypothetical protein
MRDPYSIQPSTASVSSTRALEDELVRELALRQPPARLEVLGEVLRLRNGGDDGLVDLLLVRRLRLGERLLCLGLAVREELLLGRAGGLLRRLGEVGVGELLVSLDGS